jgi:capsular polysaccharide transport system permease protein
MIPALRRHLILLVMLVVASLTSLYWLLVASDRYVSEAHVIVQRTELTASPAMDLSSLLGSGGSGRADQLLLRDHLLSVDMLRKLDAALKLRAHYSNPSHDLLSRLWAADVPAEWFHKYMLSRIAIELDDYAGVLTIHTQAYDAQTAHAVTRMLVDEGERFLNQMAHSMAQAQVDFLEGQVAQLKDRVMQSRMAVLDYQDSKGLVSPMAEATNLVGIVAKLEGQRTELQTQRAALQAYLVASHPNIIQINQQLAAVERQIGIEKGKLASPSGKTLNRTVEEYQRLEKEAVFTQDVYKTALVALERGRIEALRTVKKVSVLLQPTLPESATEPRRGYNTLVALLLVLLLGGVTQLMAAIVRDHQD